MKKMQVNKRNSKGITLIALIITVIVMLILAGVAINMTIGDNGIFKKTADSADISKREHAREKLSLVLTDVQMRRIKEGESLALSEDMASEIEGYKEITSATFTGSKINTIVDGYDFTVNGDLGIENKKEIEKVEPENLSDWEYRVEEDGTATLLKYKGSATQLIIPNYIEGYWVKRFCGQGVGITTSIWNENICEAEKNNYTTEYVQKTITEITISEGIEVIGAYAFYYSEGIEKIVIPETVTKIEGSAFYLCKTLKEISLPNTITKIEGGTFRGCDGLQNIVIPNSVTEIGSSAFEECVGLQNITIPDTVKTIGNSVFSNCTSLQKVVLPSRLKEIEKSTFWNCRSLQGIEIPNSVEKIGDGAFAFCTSMAEIRIPDSVKYVGRNSSAAHPIFYYWTSSQKIYVPFKEGEQPVEWMTDWNRECQAQIIYQQ